MKKRRPLYLMAFGAVAVPLVAASIAYACGALASLSVGTQSADVGSTVSGVGRGFSNSHGGAPSAEPVVLHFNTRNGPVLWTGRPDPSGNIEFSFSVPRVGSGSYALIATQNNADGVPSSGTPARALFTVAGPIADAVAAEAAAPAEPVAAAPAPAPAPAATPAPAPVTQTAAAPRVRVAPAAPVATPAAPAPAPAASPAPVVETPAAEATPAPAVTPAAPEAAPATPARRSVMVAMSGDSDGSPVLAIALVGVGLVLALGASALVLAGRRDSKAPARARR